MWDSHQGIVESLYATLSDLSMDPPPIGSLRNSIGPPLDESLRSLGVAAEHLDDAVSLYRHHYRRVGEPSVVLFDGAADMLARVRSDGWTLVTATSKGVDPVLRLLDVMGISEMFDAVVAAPMDGPGGDKISVVRRALDAVDAGSVSPGLRVMIGDRDVDIEAARHFGLISVAARWGYASPGELERAEPDLWAEHPGAVTDALAELRASFTSSVLEK